MGPQICKNPNFGNFGTPCGSLGTKCHLDVGLMERHIVTIRGKVVAFPKSRPW